MSDLKEKIVIIGAGPAGLAAAYKLSKTEKYDITIIESEKFVGGISRTVEYHGNHIDIGGHRFFSKSKEVNDLWNELMPIQGKPSYDDKVLDIKKDLAKDGPDPESEDQVMLLRHRVSRIYFLKKFFDYPISLKPRTFINMGFCNTIKAGFGYIGSSIHKRKENSLEDFYINRFGKPLYQMFFEDYTEKLWGIHPSKLSPDWGSQRVKGLSLWKAFISAIAAPFKKKSKKVETSLIERFEYPKYGPGQLYTKMADVVKSRGVKIVYGETVSKFIFNDNHKIVSVKTDCGNEYTADYFISSMPIKDLYGSLGKDNVGEDTYTIATTLPYRDFITVGLLLDSLKIQNKTKIKTINNIIPDNWIYVQERNVKMGRIQVFNNWSPYMVDDVNKHIWIGLEYFCSEGDDMWNMSDSDFISKAVDELISMGIIESKSNVIDSTRIKVKKAYPAYFGSYKVFQKVRDELNTFDNLFCIGRNGQHRYNNMDHSIITGFVAAEDIINGTTDKTSLWNVNSEKEYQEENTKPNESAK